MSYISQNVMNISYMSLLELLPDNLWDWLNELPPVCQSQLRSEDVALSVQNFGCSLSGFIRVFLIGSFMDLLLFFWSSVPGRRSIGCIGSIVAFLCGVFCLPTCLTGWINDFWLPFGSVTVFVIVVRFVDVAVRVRGIGVTVFVSRNTLIVFSLFSLFFQQSTLISVESWFFTVVTRLFVSDSICVGSIVAHTIYLWLITAFQTVQL